MPNRTLTDEDIAALAAAIKMHGDSSALTPDEISMLKRFLAAFDKAASIVGKLLLTAIVGAMIAMFTKGFWISLITGVKQGHP